MISEDDDMLCSAEVARVFAVSPRTVTKWANAGKLTAYRTLGGHRRYKALEIRALLADSTLPASETP